MRITSSQRLKNKDRVTITTEMAQVNTLRKISETDRNAQKSVCQQQIPKMGLSYNGP